MTNTFNSILLLLGSGYCMYQMSRAVLRRRIIQVVYLFPFMLIGLLVVMFFPWIITRGDAVLAAAFGYGMGAVIGYLFEKIRKNSFDYAPIGLGDVKLLSAGGIWLGTTGLAIAIVISCIIGVIWGWKRRQRYIPFAPFFLSGGIIAFLVMYFLI